jgi:uncharacterized protein
MVRKIFRVVRDLMAEYIVDTGPLVGWINRRDQWHTWSVEVMRSLLPPLITCESVVAELVWHLHSSREAVDQLYVLVETGALRIVELLPTHISSIRTLAAKYSQMDFCDAAVVRLSELYPAAHVITTDNAHFRIYRRFQNQTIQVIHP